MSRDIHIHMDLEPRLLTAFFIIGIIVIVGIPITITSMRRRHRTKLRRRGNKRYGH